MFKQFINSKDKIEVRIYSVLCMLGFGLHHRYNTNKIKELQYEIEKIKDRTK